MGKQWKQWQIFFPWAPKSLQVVTAAHKIKRCLLLGRKVMTNLHSVLKSRDITFPTKVHIVKGTAFPILWPPEVKKIRSTGLQRVGHDGTTTLNWTDGFSTSHIWMPELDSTNDWATKNWRLRTVLLEKILKCPVDGKEMKPGNSKGNQLWIFIGRTDAEAPVLWLSDAKSQLTGKHPDAGKDWKRKEKEATEHEMIGWYHRFSGHELGRTREDGEGQGGLVHTGSQSEIQLGDWTRRS